MTVASAARAGRDRGVEPSPGDDAALPTGFQDRSLRALPEAIPLASLCCADSPRLGGIDEDHVDLLLNAERPWTPIVVHRATMRVVDGAHRVQAAARLGHTHVDGVFCDVDESDLFALALHLNTAHGLPLSRAERLAGARRVIESHPGYSDRAIAALAGISAKTVATLRSDDGATTRIGLDGRTRPLAAREGRLRAAQVIEASPGLSLREIARSAQISVGTARDVRRRLREGRDPLPDGRDRTAARPEASVGAAREVLSDPSQLLSRLETDPSLRYSQGGRILLRLLSSHTRIAGTNDLCTVVPEHCRTAAATIARHVAEQWTQFAVTLERS